MLNKFLGIASLLLQIEDAVNPFARSGIATLERCGLGFIQPVSGDAVVRDCVHLTSAYLYLDRDAVHAEQRGV